jgi:hypothetical protein
MNRAHGFTIEVPQKLRLTNDAETLFDVNGSLSDIQPRAIERLKAEHDLLFQGRALRLSTRLYLRARSKPSPTLMFETRAP